MLLTASKMATCRIAKLRVEGIVGGWGPGVRTIFRRALFHSMTELTGAVDVAAERSSLSLFVTATPVRGIERPAHRSASVNNPFAIGLTSRFGFGAFASSEMKTGT